MREASARAGLSSGRINQIINGDLPGIEACIGIAHAFNVTPESIMFLAGYLKNDPTALDPEIEAIARRIAEAPPDRRQAAIRVVLALLDTDEP
ncbi:MAG: helix-turn-helix transcriptional regulator [Anaerolineae bacterium]|nr:helix-turn-helix transcriptional regulator [Anaerolineae bacterium]